MPHEDMPEKEMEALARAIVEAIARSKDVNEAMRKVGDADVFSKDTFMVMMLKLNELADAMGIDYSELVNEEALETDTDQSLPTDGCDVGPMILKFLDEGETLSINESLFRDYLSERFDEEAWLRKNRLSF